MVGTRSVSGQLDVDEVGVAGHHCDRLDSTAMCELPALRGVHPLSGVTRVSGDHIDPGMPVLDVGGDRVHRGDVAFVPVDKDEAIHTHRHEFLADVGQQRLEGRPAEADGAGMSGVDRRHPVGPEGHV